MNISSGNDGDADNIAFPPNTKRVMLELCTSHDSEMGKEIHSHGETAVVRITLSHDLTTPEGLSLCLSVVSAARKQNLPLCLYLSLPCTAGCPYWRIILAKHPRAGDKLTHHKKILGMLMNNAEIVHTYASSAYGQDMVLTLMEWPRGCQLWQHEAVNHFRTVLGLS